MTPNKLKNKHTGSKLTNRAERARLLESYASYYLEFPTKFAREKLDKAVLDCAKAIRKAKKK